MSIIDPKPVKSKILNPKLLPIAAVLLIILALLFMATPLLRSSRSFQNGNFALRNGQPSSTNGFPTQSGGTQFQTFSGQAGSNLPTRSFTLGGGILAGAVGSIVDFVALLVSLTAALGMFFMKRWGKVLGIIMAVLYGLIGLISILPLLFLNAIGLRNPLSFILGVVHLLLAVAVIVLASIPGKKLTASVVEVPAPSANA